MFSLHTEALCWLRFAKRMPIVCTEGGKWNADVLGMNSKMSIEVEIKNSISDLRADFRNKAHKHYLYNVGDSNPNSGWTGSIPNFFYFLTPGELKDKALEIIKDKAPKAGLICRSFPALGKYGAGQDNIHIIKKPEKLHKDPPSRSLVHAAAMRMGSEIASMRLLIDTWNDVPDKSKLFQSFHDALIGIEGTFDFENIEEDLERRGKELSWIMTKTDWEKFGHVERISWMFRAQELLNLRRGNPENTPSEKAD